MKPYLTFIRTSLALTMRDRTVLFFNYMFPLIFFFIFGFMMHAEQGGAIVQIVTMVLTIGILGSGFFGAGMRTVMDREANILRRFKVAPISAAPILVSQMVVGLVHYIPVTVLMLALAHFVYGMPVPDNLGSLSMFLLIGVCAFRAMGSIIGAVANSMAESQIIIQLLYFPMLFLGGATFPISIMPNWLQTVSQFIPTTYLSLGLKGILQRHETLWQNREDLGAAGALLLAAVVGMFLSVKLFRWEKEEPMRGAAKVWLVVVLAPFLAAGIWQSYSKDNVQKEKILTRGMRRNQTHLIRDVRLFLGDGNVIEQGAVLVKDGRIAEIYTGSAPDPKTLKADPIDAAGKTLMPGLIDVHVHLGSPGGFYGSAEDYEVPAKGFPRELAAYLYSGVTAVKSVGDTLDDVLKARDVEASGEKLGAELFVVGPLFTAPGGHGTEYSKNIPEVARGNFDAQFLRLPKTAEEAKTMVDELAKRHVDGIKTILEAGVPGYAFVRMDPALVKAIVEEAHKFKLPVVCHTGNARDVEDAVNAGVDGIEHGSMSDAIPEAVFAKMKQAGITFDPTLSVAEAFTMLAQGKFDMLDRTLVQQVGPKKLLESTRKFLQSADGEKMRAGFGKYPLSLPMCNQNLLAAMRAGVILVTGSDSGNPTVLHGPALHRELQLWIEAGVPTAVALQAATFNGAQLLRTSERMGLIKKGYEANLLLVDGNPLKEISVTERISLVMLKGERVDRGELFDQQ
jgi:imidazolonepropionase-like amidohydrolase/ABC-type multidrug transport system permease subunit